MAQHTSVIAGHQGGCIPSTLGESRAGLLVDVSNPVEIAPALRGLAEDAGRREDWGAKGHRVAQQCRHASAVHGAW